VAKQTADIDVAIVFCNAGYMLTGFFDSMCVVLPVVAPWLMSQSPCINMSNATRFLQKKCRHPAHAPQGTSADACAHWLCRPLERQLANMECNAGSAVQITHHFLARMVGGQTISCFLRTQLEAIRLGVVVTALGCDDLMSIGPRPHLPTERHTQTAMYHAHTCQPACGCHMPPRPSACAESQGAARLLRVHLLSRCSHRVTLHGRNPKVPSVL
jgi:hypothetical protein